MSTSAKPAETPVQAPAPESAADQPQPAQQEGAPVARMASLYVADLVESVTESTLYDFFRRAGNNAIASIRVCRDSQSGKSLGYAYVNFHRPAEAQQALDQLNFEPINGVPCRISWSLRDPSIRKSGVGNVFIKNLNHDIDHLALYDTFSNFGTILSCKVATDRAGNSKGYGFVHFSSEKEATRAIEALNQKLLNGKQVYVGPFIPRHQRPGGNSSDNYTNLYLRDFNPALTPKEFEELVQKATADVGKITSPKLMTKLVMNEEGKQEEVSLKFGFANFETHEMAVAAVERFKDMEKLKELVPEFLAENKSVYVNPAMGRASRKRSTQNETNLYVKNIADTVDENRLKELFAPFGTISSHTIMRDATTNVHRGFGFVSFEKKEEALAAIQKMNGFLLEGKPLYVAFAQPKEQRREMLARQHQQRFMQHVAVPYGFYPPMRMPPGAPRSFAQPHRGKVGNYPQTRPNYVPQRLPPGYPMQPQQQPQPMNEDLFTDFAKLVASGENSSKLNDYLFRKVCEDEKDEFTSKRIMGYILADLSNNPDRTQVVIDLIKNDANRRNYVQKAKESFQNASA